MAMGKGKGVSMGYLLSMTLEVNQSWGRAGVRFLIDCNLRARFLNKIYRFIYLGYFQTKGVGCDLRGSSTPQKLNQLEKSVGSI